MAFLQFFDSVFQVTPERLLPVTSWIRGASVYCTPNGEETEKARPNRSKITKADIGSPTNFKHVCHVEWKALAGPDTKSEADLKRLFNEAGIREEHLKNHKTSQKIFDIIEKRGGIEAVRKEVCEMASSGTSSPHPSLQSLSSSPLMSSKNKPIRWSYLFPACHQNPRVLACKSSCSLSAGTELPHFPPPPSPLSFNCVRSDNIDSPSSALPIGQLSSTNISLQPRPPLPSPPLSPPFTYNSQTVTMPVAAPSPPTSCFRRATQVVRYGQASQVTQLGIKSNKLPVLDQSQFLDEIKKGIHLKSVDPASETPQPSNDGGIVAALMEVIQKRHKAIFSSGDEASEDEDEWED